MYLPKRPKYVTGIITYYVPMTNLIFNIPLPIACPVLTTKLYFIPYVASSNYSCCL